MNQNEITIVPKDKSFQTIISAVDKMVDVIRPTFGPASNKVIIDSPLYYNPLVVDDGVQIARDFKLEDSVENAIVKVVRETAIRTNDRVGDGTTSSLLILQAILHELKRKGRFEGHKVVKQLKKGAEEAKQLLTSSAKEIKTKAELKKAAMVSYDNEEIADILSDLYSKLGKEATITIEKSQTMNTQVEMSEGVKIDRGYISPYMINNPERMECEINKPYILITDYRITENSDIMPIIEKMAKDKKFGLVVICENIEQQALATLVINEPWIMNPQTGKPGVFPSVAINLPTVDDKKVFLEDLALLTGAKVFSQEKGTKLQDCNIEDLGRAEKFICRKDESVIVGPKGEKKNIKFAVEKLRKLFEQAKGDSAKRKVRDRLSMFTNSLAVIRVGAPTDNEQKALKYKVEDAVNAVHVAYKHGVVCGGGMSLARLKTSSSLLNAALKYPARQLYENMGYDDVEELADDHVRNMVTGQVGKYMDVGVFDPVKVLIAQIESAVSIASILLTSSGMIVEVPRVNNK